MIRATKAQESDPSKPDLHPTHDWSEFPDRAMTHHRCSTNVLVNPLFPVEFQVYPKHNLPHKQERYERSEARMDIVCELSSLVSVSEKPSYD